MVRVQCKIHAACPVKFKNRLIKTKVKVSSPLAPQTVISPIIAHLCRPLNYCHLVTAVGYCLWEQE